MIRFASWWFLLLIPVAIYLFLGLTKKRGLKFSSVKLLKSAGNGKSIKHKTGKIIALCGVILALVALARPQSTLISELTRQQGIDIAMLLDVSGSMQSVDFAPNRLEVARQTIDDFVKVRAGDRISLIVFAGTAYTRIPLTLDRDVVRDSLARVTTESVNEDGTAIGMAISVGLNRLVKSETASRIMILVTDGDNNAGEIDPITASKLALEAGIRIYTIGIGTDMMLLPVQAFGRTQYRQYTGGFDEALLQQIAETTGGQYYRAMDSKELTKIFDTINKLEKTEFDDDNFIEYAELAFPLIALALLFFLAGIFLDRYYFVQIP
jgi:Ca-activated chloride channel family protein